MISRSVNWKIGVLVLSDSLGTLKDCRLTTQDLQGEQREDVRRLPAFSLISYPKPNLKQAIPAS